MTAVRVLVLLVLVLTLASAPARAADMPPEPEPVVASEFRSGLAVAGALGGAAASALAARFVSGVGNFGSLWGSYVALMAFMPLGTGLGVHLAGPAPLGWSVLGGFVGSAAALYPAAFLLGLGYASHLDGTPLLAMIFYGLGGSVAIGAPVLGAFLGGRGRRKHKRPAMALAVGPLLQPAGLRVSIRL